MPARYPRREAPTTNGPWQVSQVMLCHFSPAEDATGQKVRWVEAHQGIPGHGAGGGYKAIGVPEPGTFQGVPHAAGVGEPRLVHAAGQVVAEGLRRCRRQAVTL